MTAWAKPSDLLLAYKYATEREWRRHLAWLELEGYPHIAKLRSEVARVDRGRHTDSAKEQRGEITDPARQDG